MKDNIHPQWYPNAEWTCASCGTVWIVGSTVSERRLDVCANCHPFYTGEQRIMDTEGQVDRFYKRLQQRDQMVAQAQARQEDEPADDSPVADLEIGKRYQQVLTDHNLNQIGEVVALLEREGDEGLLALPGIGRKILSDIKRKLRSLGFELRYEMDEEPA